MFLFPAYADSIIETDEKNRPNDAFLSFESYKIDAPSTSYNNAQKTETTSQSIDQSFKRKQELKKKKHEKPRNRNKLNQEFNSKDKFNNQDFVIDKSKELIYLKVNKISRPSVPRYYYSESTLGNISKVSKKKKHIKRYFKSKYLLITNNNEASRSSDGGNKEIDITPQILAEADISKKTAFFNQSLGKDPFDIDLWMQYVKFQDTIWQFEKTYKKGSIAKGARVTSERKLAILDKALNHNTNNVTLSREKVIIAETTYPADEVSNYLKSYVEKHSGNITFWQGYIEATQCSMAHCNTPAVIDLYNKCLTKLHQLRRNSTLEKYLLEEKILSMLYQCGLFLRQAGLWEQLWTLLQLYLELNLSSNDKNKFKIIFQFCDKKLVELEEVILESQLPLHELWLRVEKLRESCHFLPWTTSEPCEDPQRMVFIEDVTDLIHPITSTRNTFHLTVMILTLLKIPLLPCRHSTIKELGLDYVPWSLDIVETLYAVFFPLYPVDLTNEYLLKDAKKLAVGPQYLKTQPGQEEYLNFLTTLMKNCADCLNDSERTAIFIWWLRFERLLIILNKENRFKMPPERQKGVKSSIKKFLKNELNRNNILFYREYALIEYELGNFEGAVNILITAINMQSFNSVVTILNDNERSTLCSLYRTLLELYLAEKSNLESNKVKAIEYLIMIINGNSAPTIISKEIISDVIEKYKHILTEILRRKQKPLTVSEHFVPDFFTDFIICYGWLLYLTKTPFEAGTMIENVLETIEKSDDCLWRKEILMEWYTTIFYKTCTEKLGSGMYGLFNDILHRSLKFFPNNSYLLAVACKEQSTSGCVGKPWWRLVNLLSNSGHAMPALFVVIMANQQLSKIKDDWDLFDTNNPVATLTTFKNRILSIFNRLTKSNMCSKRCGLLWRLYLQYLYQFSDSDTCRKAYYTAVEECPWLKALYIDAAIYIPAELLQIQDLIIEKQLRIHVTPEELDVLRS